jgi:thioredoxin-related protein
VEQKMDKSAHIGKTSRQSTPYSTQFSRTTGWKPCHSKGLGRISLGILACALALAALPARAQASNPVARAATQSKLTEARDLAADGKLAGARGVPLVVLYSRDDCNWCERVRREHLGPLSRDPATPALIRELHMDRTTPLIDFQGRRTTSADFSRDMKARFAPTVMFHGPDGAMLAEAIVGFRLADFYGSYLQSAIADSQQQLRREK